MNKAGEKVDHCLFQAILKFMSQTGKKEINLYELHDRIIYFKLVHIYILETAHIGNVYYYNPDPLDSQDALYFELCGYQIYCSALRENQKIVTPILKSAETISIVTSPSLSCLIQPFKYLCDKFNEHRALFELSWLLAVLNTRRKGVYVDTSGLGLEHMKYILKCNRITCLKIKKFSKDLDRLFLGKKHILSVYTSLNKKYPFLPQVRNLTIDATGFPCVFGCEIRLSIHTHSLTVIMNFEKLTPAVHAQLASFLQLKVPVLTLQIHFKFLLSSHLAQNWEVEFVSNVIDLYETVAEAAKYTKNQDQRIEIAFDYARLKDFQAYSTCKTKAASALQKRLGFNVTDDNEKHCTFSLPIKTGNHCQLLVELQ